MCANHFATQNPYAPSTPEVNLSGGHPYGEMCPVD